MGNSSQRALVPGPCEALDSGDVRYVPECFEKADILCALELDGADADAGFALLSKDGTLEAVHAKSNGTPGVEFWARGPGAATVRLSEISSNAQALLFVAAARPPARRPFGRAATGSAILKHVTRDLCTVKINLTADTNSVVLLGFHRSTSGGWHMEVVAKCYSLFHDNPYDALQPLLEDLANRAEHLRPKEILGFTKTSLLFCGARSVGGDSEIIESVGSCGEKCPRSANEAQDDYALYLEQYKNGMGAVDRHDMREHQGAVDRCDVVSQQCRTSQLCSGTPLTDLNEPMDGGGNIHRGVGVLDFNGDGSLSWSDCRAAVFLDNPAEIPPVPDLSTHHWRSMQDAHQAQVASEVKEAQEQRHKQHDHGRIGHSQGSNSQTDHPNEQWKAEFET